MNRKYLFACLILSVTVLLGACSGEETELDNAPTPDKLVFQLHWIPDAHQLGFWTALDSGLYEAANLDVTIYPGGMDANPIRDVVSGSVDIGQIGGVEQAVVAVSEGLPLKALAAIHRQSPHALISLADNPVTTAEEMQGKTIGVAYGDTAEIMLKAYMDTQGLSEQDVSLVPYRFDLSPLLSGQVDAITGFSTGQPVTILEQGKDPAVLAYDLAGIESYGYTLVSSDKTMAAKGPALKRFMQATRLGWERAFADPDTSVALFKERFGDSVLTERTHKELELIQALMLDERGELADWQLDSDRVQAVIDRLEAHMSLKKTPTAQSVFSNDLVE